MKQFFSLLICIAIPLIGFTQKQQYKRTIKPINSIILDNKLQETSGLVQFNNRLWTHNDDTDNNLYALDSITGKIMEIYNLSNVKNTDWEELAQDETHFYIGDFGNNASGNRTDLHILKVEKQSLLNRNPIIEQINFSYANQTDFSEQKPNKTNFDCEAMIVSNDSIYLFTKEWKTKLTTIYTLPKVAGKYNANKKSDFKIKGLVTGASFYKPKNELVLCGYTKKGKPFIQLFYEFDRNNFFDGKSIKLKLKPRFQQIEAISTLDGVHYYVTNENLKFLWINKPQQLQVLDLKDVKLN